MLGRKLILAIAMGLLTTFAATAQDAPAAKPDAPAAKPEAPPVKIDKDKFSYALGMQFGESFKKQSLELDPATFGKAFADAYNGGTLTMTEDDMKTILMAASQEFKKKQMAMAAEKARRRRRTGKSSWPRTRPRKAWLRCPAACSTRF